MKGLFSFLGKMNPLRLFSSYFERHPWQRRILIALPILLLLSLLAPVLGAFGAVINLVKQVLVPMTETGLGRATLLVTLLLALGIALYLFARERVLELFRRYGLSLHLRGIEALLLGQRSRARNFFWRVARLGGWIDLGLGETAAYGSLTVDARIKMARLHLEDGQVQRGRAELARIPLGLLKGRLRLSFAELNARIFAQHPGHLPESVLKVLEESHETWPGNPGISQLLAERLIEIGEGQRAAEIYEETLRATKRRPPQEIVDSLARLYLKLARDELVAGRLKEALGLLNRSLRVAESEEALLLKADLHLAREELELALNVLRGLRSPAAKARLAALLRNRKQPVEGRKVLAHVPRRDTLLALAEHFLERNELRRADRTLRLCMRESGASPRLMALVAFLRVKENAPDQARESLRLALAPERLGSE